MKEISLITMIKKIDNLFLIKINEHYIKAKIHPMAKIPKFGIMILALIEYKNNTVLITPLNKDTNTINSFLNIII